MKYSVIAKGLMTATHSDGSETYSFPNYILMDFENKVVILESQSSLFKSNAFVMKQNVIEYEFEVTNRIGNYSGTGQIKRQDTTKFSDPPIFTCSYTTSRGSSGKGYFPEYFSIKHSAGPHMFNGFCDSHSLEFLYSEAIGLCLPSNARALYIPPSSEV
jgi:hypothetical protein